MHSRKAEPAERGQAPIEIAKRLEAKAAELRRLLGVHLDRTRQQMFAEKISMMAVVENGRHGYRFKGRLRLDDVLFGEAFEQTSKPVVAPTGMEPVFESRSHLRQIFHTVIEQSTCRNPTRPKHAADVHPDSRAETAMAHV